MDNGGRRVGGGQRARSEASSRTLIGLDVCSVRFPGCPSPAFAVHYQTKYTRLESPQHIHCRYAVVVGLSIWSGSVRQALNGRLFFNCVAFSLSRRLNTWWFIPTLQVMPVVCWDKVPRWTSTTPVQKLGSICACFRALPVFLFRSPSGRIIMTLHPFEMSSL